MKIGSLFAGIGGLELGLERAGCGEVVWQVEQDEFCRNVLAMHWPMADRSVSDVQKAGAENLGRVDIICGGFPCQDISNAGHGAGLAGARSGLWFQYLRIVNELKPRFVVIENVSALKNRGLDVVIQGLSESGYDAIWTTLRASDVGAPHKRERLFIVAYARGVRLEQRGAGVPRCSHGNAPYGHESPNRCAQNMGYPSSKRLHNEADVGEMERPRSGEPGACSRSGGEVPKPVLDRSANGIPNRLDLWPATRGEDQKAWEPPRTYEMSPRERKARIHALGNAVVPQCAELIGTLLMEIANGNSQGN